MNKNQEKLEKIYKFLNENRYYNKYLQERLYKLIILSEATKIEKVLSILYHVVNTQSQPDINYISEFFVSIKNCDKSFESFGEFVKMISGKESNNYKDLYLGLKNKKGWGEKTAALFVKIIFHLHNGNYDKSIRIWDDVPSTIESDDNLYIPVDQVIKRIFEELGFEKRSFTYINKEISEYYSGDKIEVWDDLWFWGFITQKIENKKRIVTLNFPKYWALRFSDKSDNVLLDVQKKAEEFISLLN